MREVHPGGKSSRAARVTEFSARLEQSAKLLRGARPAAHRAKLDVAFSAARLGSRPRMADGESSELSSGPGQHSVAQTLSIHGANFPLHIEPLINGARQLPASLHAKFLVAVGKVAVTRPALSIGSNLRRDRQLHERGEKAR